MSRFLQLLVVASLLFAEFGYAQLRTIPPNAKRATVGQPQVLPMVELSGKVVRLAPGGVIYDENNRMIVHNALPPGADVAVTPAIGGDIARIYILTPFERAQFDKKK